MRDTIIVLDFGSQYAHLIAKRIRAAGYYAEIALPSTKTTSLVGAKGIVLSGGPSSVYEHTIPEYNPDIFSLDIPILGLCYGHQLMAKHYGGKVEKAPTGEFGIASFSTENPETKNSFPDCPLFKNIPFPAQVWMSHQDSVTKLGKGFVTVGSTRDCEFAALQNLALKRFSLQFHVEVKDTPQGGAIFENFAELCGMEKNWDQDTVLKTILDQIQKDSKGRKVLLFLSGGVDSTVAFALLNKALGQERVLGLHIDNGFMRKNESAQIARRYRQSGFNNFILEDASKVFLQAVYKKTDPQQKRRAVGETFIRVRDAVVKRLNLDESQWLLGQGTLYPDIIESGGSKNAHIIKTHHNRVRGIEVLIEKGLIIEPLKDLYKDEVRILGKKIGLENDLVYRHPFPGPGLSINVLCYDGCSLDQQELAQTQESLFRIQHEIENQLGELSGKRATGKLGVLPVKSVGVKGDFRTYCYPAVLRFDYSQEQLLPWSKLETVSSLITNGISQINRTVLALYEEEGCILHEGYCTRERLDQTREVDALVLEELRNSGWYDKIFQHLTIHLPYSAKRSNCSIVLRPVVSEDVMTARFAQLDSALLFRISEGIKKLGFVEGLYYDITNKPPATFGWE